MKTKFIFIFLLSINGFCAITQTLKPTINTENKKISTTEKIVQNAVEPFFKDSTRVGLSIGIYINGKEYYFNYGSIEKEQQKLPSNNSIYEIGSISKTLMGTLLAQAVKYQKVKIDDDIRLYLDGEYPNLEYNKQAIKLSHLVSHISGLPNFLPDDPKLFENPNFDILPFTISKVQNNYSKADFLKDLHEVKLDTVPGFNFRYSNSGAQLLKFILEKVYKKPFDKIIIDNLTKPLKMVNTNTLFTKNNMKKLVKGYNGKGILMPYNPQMLDAAGGIFSTTADMLKYLKYHLNEADEVVALSHKVTTGDINDYALGLNWQEQIDSKKNKKIWQSGGTFGFSSYCVLYPELSFTVILLSNESDQSAQGELEKIANYIYENIDLN